MANEQGREKSDFVTVGCKLTHGLRAEIIPVPENTQHNWNPKPAGPRVKFNGANSVAHENGLVRVNPRINEFGKTVGVPRAFWDQWAKQDAAKALIAKGLVFIVSNEPDFKAQAQEKLAEKTGLEGLNPEGKDERIRKLQVPGKSETQVETDEEHLKKLRDSLAA